MKKDDFMKKIIIAMAIFLLIFTIVMIITYYCKDDIPDALVAAVFTACLGEGTITSMIQKAKINHGAIDAEEDEEEYILDDDMNVIDKED